MVPLQKMKHEHDWGILRYLLAPDRMTVFIVDRCEGCGVVREYERPTMPITDAVVAISGAMATPPPAYESV